MKITAIALPLAILILISYGLLTRTCNILPKNANYKIVLRDELYTLTPHGLIEEGFIVDHEKIKFFNGFYARFNRAKQTIYFTGVSKLNLAKKETVPTLIQEAGGTRISVSPDGNLLLFNHGRGDSNIWLFNFKNNNKTKIINDFVQGACTPVWINDTQFLYKNNKYQTILFDINSATKTDLRMDVYWLGEVTPDGKEILMSSKTKTILYNLFDHSIKIIMKDKIYPTCMIWLPDGKGFMYLKHKWYDAEVADLYYHSMENNSDVRLIKNFSILMTDISTGFAVPADIDIKIVDNQHNKRRPLPMTNRLMKICSK